MDPLREFHLPFLFSVLCHMKPRRYVELGPDICVSAIAAGQTMRNSRLSNELVAVYSWDCEYHPAQYKDKLRHGFQVLRDHLEGRLESSVKNPEEAEGLFADGSIDLLQININHGYASAEQAYNSWLPKVSKNGCIILNNTVGCHSNFSMANFFAKIRKSANATYDFHNNTGLSLIALGEADYNPMISVIEAMKKNRLDLENYYCEFSSDRFVSLESCCIADYLKTYQKYSRFKFMPTLTRWLKKVGKLPLLYNSIK